MASLFRIVKDTIRVLTFRQPLGDISNSWKSYLAVGLFFTWVAGMGRYWDNPRAEIEQHLGLGSVVYVFALALLLWLLICPLRPERWSYKNVLIFVTLTSPPAILYAIPVERFMSLEDAQVANVWFLAVVAVWRVALLVWFLRCTARLSGLAVLVASLLPLTLIVFALTVLNLEHVVFDLMGGLRPEDRSPNDSAYMVVFLLTLFSFYAAPVLLLMYALLVYFAQRKHRSLMKSQNDA